MIVYDSNSRVVSRSGVTFNWQDFKTRAERQLIDAGYNVKESPQKKNNLQDKRTPEEQEKDRQTKFNKKMIKDKMKKEANEKLAANMAKMKQQ